MKIVRTASLLLSVGIIAGCASGPNVEEMSQLNGDEVKQLRVGSTYQLTADWGNWTEVTNDDLTSVAQATGSFGTEIANGVSTVSAEGEWCTVYSGEYNWSKPDFEYCVVTFRNVEGNYFTKGTKNDRQPERVGVIRAITVTKGDNSNLLTQ